MDNGKTYATEYYDRVAFQYRLADFDTFLEAHRARCYWMDWYDFRKYEVDSLRQDLEHAKDRARSHFGRATKTRDKILANAWTLPPIRRRDIIETAFYLANGTNPIWDELIPQARALLN